MAEVNELSKGGECWLQMTLERRSRGIEVWVKADPRLEEFIASLGISGLGEEKPDKPTEMSKLTTKWVSSDPDKKLYFYSIYKELRSEEYRLDIPGETLGVIGGWTNLSFLRFVGIGTEGVRFIVLGAYDRRYVKSICTEIIRSCRELIKDYIAPVHVNLRISSTEI